MFMYISIIFIPNHHKQFILFQPGSHGPADGRLQVQPHGGGKERLQNTIVWVADRNGPANQMSVVVLKYDYNMVNISLLS